MTGCRFLGQRDWSPQRVLQASAVSALLIPAEKGKTGAGCFTSYSHGIFRLCRRRWGEG